MDSVNDHPDGWGFPIRKSPDQSVLATPRSLSQPITSFIASQCQGIRQTPLLCLIPQLFVSETTILRSSLRLVPCRGRTPARRPHIPTPTTPPGKTERGDLDFKDLILPINDVKERSDANASGVLHLCDGGEQSQRLGKPDHHHREKDTTTAAVRLEKRTSI